MTFQKFSILSCLVAAVIVFSQPAFAQQKKGDKEVLGFASGFSFNWGGAVKPRDLEGSGGFTSYINSQTFSVSGNVGYFLTHKNEIGGGLGFSVARFKFCTKSFSNGRITAEQCETDSNVGLGLGGFYRYNFATPDAKGFPFVGASISIADVTSDYTGNVSARPHIGYKYFVKKNVALDFSVGYSIDINKSDNDNSFFIIERRNSVNGQLGLSFLF